MIFAFTSSDNLYDINVWAQGYSFIGIHHGLLMVDSDYIDFLYFVRRTKPEDAQYNDNITYEHGDPFISFMMHKAELPF